MNHLNDPQSKVSQSTKRAAGWVVTSAATVLLCAPASAQSPKRGAVMSLDPQGPTTAVLQKLVTDTSALRDWGANLVRFSLIHPGVRLDHPIATDPDEYLAWLDGQLDQIEHVTAPNLAIFGQGRMQVLINLQDPPGGFYSSGPHSGEMRLFYEQDWESAYLSAIRSIATRCQAWASGPNPSAIWGVDLLNEPAVKLNAEGRAKWRALAQRAAARVKNYAPNAIVVIEPLWGRPDEMAPKLFRPVSSDPTIHYGPHFYTPVQFTGQGVTDPPAPPHYPIGPVYPGCTFGGTTYDKSTLEGALGPTVAFASRYQKPIFIGEWTASRVAPNQSAFRWMRDVATIIDERGWSSTYHAFRESWWWDVEFDEDPASTQPAGYETSRQRLIRSWFQRNIDSRLDLAEE